MFVAVYSIVAFQRTMISFKAIEAKAPTGEPFVDARKCPTVSRGTAFGTTMSGKAAWKKIARRIIKLRSVLWKESRGREWCLLVRVWEHIGVCGN